MTRKTTMAINQSPLPHFNREIISYSLSWNGSPLGFHFNFQKLPFAHFQNPLFNQEVDHAPTLEYAPLLPINLSDIIVILAHKGIKDVNGTLFYRELLFLEA